MTGIERWVWMEKGKLLYIEMEMIQWGQLTKEARNTWNELGNDVLEIKML